MTDNTFQNVICSILDISMAYQTGLSALRKEDKNIINFEDTRKIDGSVDIDDATKSLYPQENRWDYVISYKGEYLYFVEVHPATNGTVKDVIAKRNWLLKWLSTKALPLNNYVQKEKKQFIWIHSGRFGLLKTSREYRLAAKYGLIPQKELRVK